MIGFISGKVVTQFGGKVIVKLATGMGYLVQVSPLRRYLQNENLDLYILHITKDNSEELYGFDNLDDRKSVENLLKVNGVGPKMAANIVYSLGSAQISQAIESGDHKAFCSVKGLGVKTAKKIVLELKSNQESIERIASGHVSGETVVNFTETLSSLGYKRSEVVGAISKMKKNGEWNESGDLVDLVKDGLKYLGKY